MNLLRPFIVNVLRAAPDTEAAGRPHAFPLALAAEGERVRISALKAGKGLVHRMMELGLPLGTEIRVAQRGRGGAMVVERDTMRVALGAGMVNKVMVTLAGSAPATSADAATPADAPTETKGAAR